MVAALRASRLPGAALLLISATAAVVGGLSLTTQAADDTIGATQIRTMLGAEVGDRVQGLVWQGGIEMKSAADNFGGLSGLGFTGPDGRLVMVSDRGNFVSGLIQLPRGLCGSQGSSLHRCQNLKMICCRSCKDTLLG